jgi:FKBP-type peptidyl-prolyl cis-trans isomerase FkpA
MTWLLFRSFRAALLMALIPTHTSHITSRSLLKSLILPVVPIALSFSLCPDLSLLAGRPLPQVVSSVHAKSDSNLYTRTASGVEFYDYAVGEGAEAKVGDKVAVHAKGFLAGRQGWLYLDTYAEDRPCRIVLGTDPCIKGLELGIAGTDDMPAMKRGGKRRLVIPSRLGYKSREQEPIPQEEGQRRRLYSTVLNSVRGDREEAALGDSLTGKLVLDVTLRSLKSAR